YTETGYAATELAVFDAETQTLKYVTGLPTDVSGFGNAPYTENGICYMPVTTSGSEQPAIYQINPTTAVATKGITVESNQITAVGCLVAVEY
ncbi:MAG: DUF4374 domain-containing protein, partial [Phocaeicola sp.]